MNYNIEFQIASILFVSILMIVFFSKKRWPSPANVVFRILMILTWVILALDIVSVITITKHQAGDPSVTFLNNFLSKFYLVVMVVYIASMDIYAIVNTIYDDITPVRKTLKYVEGIIWIIACIIATIVIIVNPLLYGGEGKYIYSYGIPSSTVYIFSSSSVVFIIVVMAFNFKKVKLKRFVPILTFCVMEGMVALIQMLFKELLIIGLGIAVVCLVMYFCLENPDMNMIEELNKANKRSRDLLLNILPLSVATKLEFQAKPFFAEFDDVTIMFLDIVNFTKMSAEIGEVKLVKILNAFFGELDDLLNDFKIEKIKTIGDAYMVSAGAPDRYSGNCGETVKFARQVLRHLKEFNQRYNLDLHVRIGINNGRVVAGVIGKKKFVFDLWGSAVNLASRLEGIGEIDKITISENVRQILGDSYPCTAMEIKDVKGFGKLQTYVLN
ncbi:MAG: adenylate/guanylate cyclase domain-containing protein [Treponema sp.]|uniref:adenylate/guanylate cyclase domain-containing protein n=1 Tax=Treponema sp. TaxID=166 RepID=UPI001B58EB85|nr:adenylate/guanylate cyclase domain-containing protein [Treponema sp.]MBP5401927.1 adenylate/guanylate cyclase domain-containing protein [Treponema sp.]MBR5932480.1 adenylate/guanylate cyclase domain-containing protein [Treponema sp.]